MFVLALFPPLTSRFTRPLNRLLPVFVTATERASGQEVPITGGYPLMARFVDRSWTTVERALAFLSLLFFFFPLHADAAEIMLQG